MNKLKANTIIDTDVIKEQSRKILQGSKSAIPTVPVKEQTVKINIILPMSMQWKFKTICMYQGVHMRDKAFEVLKDWLDKQPDTF